MAVVDCSIIPNSPLSYKQIDLMLISVLVESISRIKGSMSAPEPLSGASSMQLS